MIVTDAGRGAVDAAALGAQVVAGRVGERPVSDQTASRRTMLMRTAKSCGPDAPMLASSSRRLVGPTGRGQNLNPLDDGGKRARSPGRARHKPLKPSRAGMPGDSGVLVYSCAFLLLKRTRACGCSGHPAFPTPSLGGKIHQRLGRFASRGRERVSGVEMSTLVMPGQEREARLRAGWPGHPSSSQDHFEEDGLPGIGERKRRRPSDGYARR
jgi:hypothetical protein